MKKTKNKSQMLIVNLQLFADGGDGGTASGGETGVQSSAAEMSNNTGVNPTSPGVESKAEEIDLGKQFEADIAGKYKEFYGKKVSETVQKRVKTLSENAEKYKAISSVLPIIAKKYGIDVNDINAIADAIENDDSYYEAEALERNESVENIRKESQLDRKINYYNDLISKQKADETLQEWRKQGEALKTIYPNFDLNEEASNEKFIKLLQSGIDVQTAYEALHHNEIMPQAMQYAAKIAEQKVANSVKANGMRPMENGASMPAITKRDVSQLSKAEREALIKRAASGERITADQFFN